MLCSWLFQFSRWKASLILKKLLLKFDDILKSYQIMLPWFRFAYFSICLVEAKTNKMCETNLCFEEWCCSTLHDGFWVFLFPPVYSHFSCVRGELACVGNRFLYEIGSFLRIHPVAVQFYSIFDGKTLIMLCGLTCWRATGVFWWNFTSSQFGASSANLDTNPNPYRYFFYLKWLSCQILRGISEKGVDKSLSELIASF